MSRSHDRWIAVFLVAFSIWGFIKSMAFPERVGYFPCTIFGLLFLFSVILLATAIRKDEDYQKGRPLITSNALFVFGMSALSVFLIKILGFYIAAALLIAVIAWYFRGTDLKTILLAIVAFDLFVYLIFDMQLKVPIPMGIFF